MCVFVSRPMKIATFPVKNGDHPKRVVDFLLEKTFRKQNHEIVEDFDEKSYNNNGKSWKSSRILRVNPFFHVSFFFHHFLSFSIIFFHFLSFSLSLLGAQNLIFLCLNFVTIPLDSS